MLLTDGLAIGAVVTAAWWRLGIASDPGAAGQPAPTAAAPRTTSQRGM
jgi:hypothetical protein